MTPDVAFERLLDRPIAFQRAFAHLTGSVAAALMLSQACYWSRRKSNEDGWFWKTQEEWHEETGMKRYEQEQAREKLRSMPFWREERRGVPAKLFFCVDFVALKLELQNAEGLQTRMQKVCNQESRGSAIITSSKSTPKTTAETSHAQPEPTGTVPKEEPDYRVFVHRSRAILGFHPSRRKNILEAYEGCLERARTHERLLEALEEWVVNRGGKEYLKKNKFRILALHDFFTKDGPEILESMDEDTEKPEIGAGIRELNPDEDD